LSVAAWTTSETGMQRMIPTTRNHPSAPLIT
jgi:hypothetical protein